jgi:hypothetical protein
VAEGLGLQSVVGCRWRVKTRSGRATVADRRPPVSFNGTSVGLDVHALSVVAHAVDEETGHVERARLCPDHGEILDWLHRLRGRCGWRTRPARQDSGWHGR